MLDHVSVFTKTGVVLWSRTMAKLKGTTNPVNTLIADVLLEEKGGGTRSHTIDQYTLRWRLVNELELVIVVVYQKILQLLYVDDLLEAVAREIVTRFGDGLRGNHRSCGWVPDRADEEVHLVDRCGVEGAGGKRGDGGNGADFIGAGGGSGGRPDHLTHRDWVGGQWWCGRRWRRVIVGGDRWFVVTARVGVASGANTVDAGGHPTFPSF